MSEFVNGYVEVKVTYEGIARSLFTKSVNNFTRTVKVPVCGKPNYSATIESYLNKECCFYQIADGYKKVTVVNYEIVSEKVQDLEESCSLYEMSKKLPAKDFCNYLKEKGITFSISL